MEPENHPFEKENHLNQTFTFGFHVNFRERIRVPAGNLTFQRWFAAIWKRFPSWLADFPVEQHQNTSLWAVLITCHKQSFLLLGAVIWYLFSNQYAKIGAICKINVWITWVEVIEATKGIAISRNFRLSEQFTNPGWLGYIGDELLPSYIGNIIIKSRES